MINIILLGDLNDTSVSEVLSPALARYGGVKYVSAKIFFTKVWLNRNFYCLTAKCCLSLK